MPIDPRMLQRLQGMGGIGPGGPMPQGPMPMAPPMAGPIGPPMNPAPPIQGPAPQANPMAQQRVAQNRQRMMARKQQGPGSRVIG